MNQREKIKNLHTLKCVSYHHLDFDPIILSFITQIFLLVMGGRNASKQATNKNTSLDCFIAEILQFNSFNFHPANLFISSHP